MATRPLICKSDIANTLIERGAFDRCTFKVTKDSAVLNTFNFCDFSLDIGDYFTQNVKLKGHSAFLVDDAGLGNSFGEVKFFLIKVTYPSGFTKDTDRYINLLYLNETYPVGEICILTGEPGGNAGMGIAVDPEGTQLTSPYFSAGGIVIYNPHDIAVDCKLIIASGASPASAGTSGTMGTAGTSGTSASSGTSGTSYVGTSGNSITIP
jgi:hypothetical protein